MLEDLQRALESGALSVFYQPQINMIDYTITGFEALIRWKLKDGSYVPPAIFIPLAEQSGLIVEIGEWLVRHVFLQIAEWNRLGFTGFRVAINISVRQFYSPAFIPYIQDQLKQVGVHPSQLELEITESMAMNAMDEVITMLQRLRALGFKIALDDFGTGFSSLSYLQRLPIDRIKIDRAFVMTIHQEEKQRTIAQTIVAMGQNLGLELIAEGVEEKNQSDILIKLGCHEAQGYLYGKPMDSGLCTSWLQDSKGQWKGPPIFK
jgi:EAL domain-containing protein (putative c-di-GMP-specific phosphodiesterase class I)